MKLIISNQPDADHCTVIEAPMNCVNAVIALAQLVGLPPLEVARHYGIVRIERHDSVFMRDLNTPMACNFLGDRQEAAAERATELR